MIFVFISLIFLLSAAYFIVVQYYPAETVTAVYASAITILYIVFVILERRKRSDIVKRVTDLFDGKAVRVNDENELSGFERRVALSLKNSAAHEEAVSRSYKNIASLVSDISHQCKTPLSSIRLYSEMPPNMDNLAAINSEAEKLSFLLDALTKLSRCEGGLIAENLHPSVNQLEELICTAVNSVIAFAVEKNIEIRADASDALYARFDMRWTAEALFNLLDNAVKYSPAGSVVTVTASIYEMFARIDVKDCGIGIPEEELASIWKRFYRGRNTSGTTAGVGIGLYLSQLILNSEGGRISVKSESGVGSTFSLFLPVQQL